MAPFKKRKSVVVKTEKSTAMIDTTPLETIDADGDLTLRFTYTPAKDQSDDYSDDSDDDNDDMSGMSTKAEPDGGASGETRETREKWKPSGIIELLVSAKHLTLVSPVFKEMLKESPKLIELPDDDLEAFKIVLNIIHGRVRQVPLDVNLKMLRSIAIIVEKYRMVEVAELYVKIWVKDLPLPSVDNLEMDIVDWIGICWIFKLSSKFGEITRLAVWETSSRISTPVNENFFPSRILDRIESQRKDIIYSTVYAIQKITDQCTCGNGICPDRPERSTPSTNSSPHRKACDAMILGSVLKSAFNVGLWPLPEAPYSGLTVTRVMDAACGLKMQSLCETIGRESTGPGHGAHGYNKSVKKAIEKREAEARGLTLEEFGG